jgi:hypothetical protein
MAVEVVGKLARVTAVIVAQALTTQKLVSDQVKAVHDVTSSPTRSRARAATSSDCTTPRADRGNFPPAEVRYSSRSAAAAG